MRPHPFDASKFSRYAHRRETTDELDELNLPKFSAANVPDYPIERYIHVIRGQKVLLDFELAALYDVEPRALTQAVGLVSMPSLGRTFGGNGDFLGAWFKEPSQSPVFESAPVLGRFKVDGQDTPFLGMWAMAGIDTVPLLPGWKRKPGKTVPLIGMGADTGKASARYEKGAVLVDYDPKQQPIFDKIRQDFRALEIETGLKTWAIKKPITVHAWGGACLGPSPDCGVVDHRGEVYGNPGLFITDASALPAAVGTPPSLAIAAWAHHVADGLAQMPA